MTSYFGSDGYIWSSEEAYDKWLNRANQGPSELKQDSKTDIEHAAVNDELQNTIVPETGCQMLRRMIDRLNVLISQLNPSNSTCSMCKTFNPGVALYKDTGMHADCIEGNEEINMAKDAINHYDLIIGIPPTYPDRIEYN